MIAKNEIKVILELIQKGKYFEAETLLKSEPFNKKNPKFEQLFGVIAFQKKRFAEALFYFERAQEQFPGDGFLQNNLGLAYKVLGHNEKAKLAFERAAEYQRDFAEPLNQLALMSKQECLIEQAEILFLEAISRNKNYAEAHYNLALLLEEVGRLSEAKTYYQLALKAKPGYLQAINNLGTILDELGECDTAEKLYRNGIFISPKTSELHCNLGSSLQQQGKYSEAIISFQNAVGLDPNFLKGRWNLGYLQLAMGDLSGGWKNYRYRHTADRRIFVLPTKRLAAKLEGQVIKVAGEQGLGDQIFFSRFFRELKSRGAIIKFKPDPKILSLFQPMDGIIVDDFSNPSFLIADLPYLLKNDTFIDSVIMRPKEKVRLKMLRRLEHCGPSPYIGVTYKAGGVGAETLLKKAPVREIGMALRKTSATIISVQRNPEVDELLEMSSFLGRNVMNFSDVNENIDEALALMSVLDDYIGVSNTNMHLRAAVGKTARVLVAHPGEFRWQVRGNVSPWFPDFRLYRQDINANWERAFAKLKLDIKDQYD